MSRYDNAKSHMPSFDLTDPEHCIPVSHIPHINEVDRLRNAMWMIRNRLDDNYDDPVIAEALDMLDKALGR